MSEEQQMHQDESVQSQQPDQGTQVDQVSQPQEPQQPIDYEKAYRNLEKDYTRKSQRLSELEKWAQFQERTGINAEQALQQLEQYQGSIQQPQQQPDAYSAQAYAYSPYDDTRISQLEQELIQMRRDQQAQSLRKRFPQFDEIYPDVLNLADSQGLDLETAFGRVLVDKWDDVAGKIKQQVIDTIRAKGTKQLEPSQSPDDGTDATNDLTPEELEAAKALGIAPDEYAQMKDAKITID